MREGWVRWPRRAFAVHDFIHGCRGWFLTERNRTGEDLDGCKLTVSQRPTHKKPHTAHLDHDHCEGENI